MMTSLWFDSTNHGKPWYIGRHVEVISEKLKKICPPKEISRLPQSLNDRKFWKGSEWRSFLLFYSLPVLHGYLQTKYLNHWFLLVFSIHCLLQNKVHRCQLDNINMTLCKFIIFTEELYGKENITFNMHQLYHLVNSVKDFGPLWNVSSFIFEGNNGALLKYFHGTRHVPMQICSRFLIWRDLPRRARNCLVGADETVLDAFDSMTTGCK